MDYRHPIFYKTLYVDNFHHNILTGSWKLVLVLITYHWKPDRKVFMTKIKAGQ